MAVSDGFRDFVIEQLERTTRDIRTKRMFGGVGIYAGDHFFAVIDNDTLFFKVDDETRPKFVRRKLKPFMPYGPDGGTIGYYEVPVDLLEDADALKAWVADAVAVAHRAGTNRQRARTPRRRAKTKPRQRR